MYGKSSAFVASRNGVAPTRFIEFRLPSRGSPRKAGIQVRTVRRELAGEIEALLLVAVLGTRQIEAANPTAHERDLMQRRPPLGRRVRIRLVSSSVLATA
jgi:hypothetical protein